MQSCRHLATLPRSAVTHRSLTPHPEWLRGGGARLGAQGADPKENRVFKLFTSTVRSARAAAAGPAPHSNRHEMPSATIYPPPS